MCSWIDAKAKLVLYMMSVWSEICLEKAPMTGQLIINPNIEQFGPGDPRQSKQGGIIDLGK